MMKELYISPEVNIISFVSAERLASDSVAWDDLMGENQKPASYDEGDINIEF